MPRSRLAVALVVPEPHRTEVDGLRRATGGDIDRIAPHITLVPPVNVADAGLDEALAMLRAAAARAGGPVPLVVGPAATFAPVNRVLYLAVDGAPAAVDDLLGMREVLLHGVLHRQDRREFVPHVTLSHRLVDGDDEHALAVLAGYRREVVFDRVDLLRFDEEARRWSTLADAVLGSTRVVGRGGVELEVVTSTVVDPRAALVTEQFGEPPASVVEALADRSRAVVVTARQEAAVVGVAVGRVDDDVGRVAGIGVVERAWGTGIGRHLLAELTFSLARRDVVRLVAAADLDRDLAGLLTAHGWTWDDHRTLVRHLP